MFFAQLVGFPSFLYHLLEEIVPLFGRRLPPNCGGRWLGRFPDDIVKADPDFVIIVIGLAQHNNIEIIG